MGAFFADDIVLCLADLCPRALSRFKARSLNACPGRMDAMKLSDAEGEKLDGFLARVKDGKIPNTEALDGFFAAVACCPDLIMPSEYLPVIQSGGDDEGDLVFEDMREAQLFMELVNRQYNHVNEQLQGDEFYLPLVLEDENGDWSGNDWANGFLTGTHLRYEIWAELFNDEERGGSIVPIVALANEHHPDPELRTYDEPISAERREDLIVAAAAGVVHMHRHFISQRSAYSPSEGTFVRTDRKVGRNEPCPCDSGKKFKQCCGKARTLH